jgi:flagellar basal body rod protein FlgB
MPSFNLLVDAVALAMDVSHSRATAASHNVAYANVPGARTQRADFGRAQGLLSDVAHGQAGAGGAVQAMRAAGIGLVDAGQAGGDVSLDDEVTEMVEASGRYQALTDTLGRQFSLMSLALSGDQS